MKLYAILLCALWTFSVNAQTIYKEINSAYLNDTRQLQIKLPKDYEANSDTKYPVIVVFDGDYLFEIVSGQVHFQSHFNDMPSSIIIGVIQGEQRYYDAYCDEVTGLPKESGLRFHNFVESELIPFIDNNYNTSKFKVAVGHNTMGNFINSFLFKKEPIFNAYVCISPDLSGTVRDYLSDRLAYFEKDIFYYMATSEKDMSRIKSSVRLANKAISQVESPYLTYYFDDFDNQKHYTLVTSAVAKSFDKIFQLYEPLREKELTEKVMPYEDTLDKYLLERYEKVSSLFGVEQHITEEEIKKVVEVAEQRNDIESLKALGKLSNKLFPNSLAGTFYLAQYAEKKGKRKKAKKLYESALELEDVAHINKDYIFSKIEDLSVTDTDESNELNDHEEN